MAKQKTKKVHWNTTCTEVQLGVWEWTYQDKTWRLDTGRRGLNFFAQWGDHPDNPLLRFDKLSDAVMFTYGYSSGEQYGRQDERAGRPVKPEDQANPGPAPGDEGDPTASG